MAESPNSTPWTSSTVLEAYVKGNLIPVTLCYCYEAEYDNFCHGAQGLLSGFSIGVRNGTRLSIHHLLFAYNTAVFL